MRNDIRNSALAKSPFGRTMASSAYEEAVEYNKWDKLQFLQRGNCLVGAINGIVMFDEEDD